MNLLSSEAKNRRVRAGKADQSAIVSIYSSMLEFS